MDSGLKHLSTCPVFGSFSRSLQPVDLDFMSSFDKKKTPTNSSKKISGEFSSVFTLAEKLIQELPKVNPPVSTQDGEKFRKDLIEVMVELHWPLTHITNKNLRDLFIRWNANILDYYPKASEIETIMKQAVTQAETEMQETLQDMEGAAICLSVDGWTSVRQTHLLGAVVSCKQFMFSTSYRYDALSQTAVFCAKAIENAMHDLSVRLNANVNNLITDNASSYRKARSLLAIRHPNILMLPCFAHQINLITQKLLKVYEYDVLEHARKLVIKLKNSYRYTFIYRQYCKSLYGRDDGCSLHKIGLTRWNSAHRSLCSILRCRNAVKKTCDWILANEKIPAKEKANYDYLFNLNVDFFTDCEKMEFLLRPLVIASLNMQRQQETIAGVLKTYLMIYGYFKKVRDTSLREALLMDMETRWKQLEQPLFVLTLGLHPNYCGTFQRMLPHLESTFKLGRAEWAVYCSNYYRKFIEGTCSDEELLLESLMNWLGKKGHRMTTSTNGWPKEPVLFWNIVGDKFPVLSQLATFLLSCRVQSADCERLFSTYGLYLTPSRNRLKHETYIRLGTINMHNHSFAAEDKKTRTSRHKMLSPTEYPIVSSTEEDMLPSDFSENTVVTPFKEKEDNYANSEYVGEWLKANASTATNQNVHKPVAESESDGDIDLPLEMDLKMFWETFFKQNDEDNVTLPLDLQSTNTDVVKEAPNLDFAGDGYRAAHPLINNRSEVEVLAAWRRRKMSLEKLYEIWAAVQGEEDGETVELTFPQVKRKVPNDIPQTSVSQSQPIGTRAKRRGKGRKK